jgi:hypothetical protein
VPRRKVVADGRDIELTDQEFRLLHLLATHAGIVEDDRRSRWQPAGAGSQHGYRPHAHQGAVPRLSVAEAARRWRLRQHRGDGGQGAHQPVLPVAHHPTLAPGAGYS